MEILSKYAKWLIVKMIFIRSEQATKILEVDVQI